MKYIFIFAILLKNFSNEGITNGNTQEFGLITENYSTDISNETNYSTVNFVDKCCSRSCKVTRTDFHADCSGRGCVCVPQLPYFIHSLRISFNQIKYLKAYAFVDFPYLKQIVLNQNILSDMDSLTFANCSASSLNFNNNKISQLPDFLFSQMKNLKIVYLNHNTLDTFNLKAFKNNNLEQIFINFNKLNDIPIFKINNESVFKNLKTLSIEGNNVKNFNDNFFKGIENLNFINFGNNNIGKLDAYRILYAKNLQYVMLAKNSLYKITESAFTSNSLKNLSLYQTGFVFRRNINYFENLTNLRYLDISQTKISTSRIEEYQALPMSKLFNLEYLRIRNNYLTEEKLRYLLINLTKLTILDASTNSVEYLSADMFQVFASKMRHLTLTNNKLKIVNSSTFPFEMWRGLSPIKQLDFYSNPFQCDCNVLWLRKWLKSNFSLITNSRKYICDSPPKLRGTRIIDLITPTEAECFEAKLSKITIFSIIIFVLYAISTLVAVIHRYRWHARYALFIYRIRNKKTTEAEEREYNYDAFVSYCWSDRKWVVEELALFETKNNIKFCFHDRDWSAGKFILDNIFESMMSSRKVVIVVSNAYASSHWCQVELTLVQSKLFELDNDKIIILLMEDLLKGNISPRLLIQLQKKTYIRWPRCNEIGEGEGVKLFWIQLKRALECRTKRATSVTSQEIIELTHM